MPDEDAPRFTVTTVALDGSYGLPFGLSAGLRVPVQVLRLRRKGAETVETEGLGDLQAIGAWRAGSRGAGPYATIGAGASLPTGRTRPRPIDPTTGAVLQLGSGTVDPLAFASAGYRLPVPLAVEASVAGKATLYDNDHGFREGAQAVATAAAEAPLPWGLAPGVEVEWRVRGRGRQDGEELGFTGGEAIKAGPRLRARMGESLAIEGRASWAVHERVNERQLESGLEVGVALAWLVGPFE